MTSFGWNSILLQSFILHNQNNKHLDVMTSKAKAKASDSYIARLTGTKPDQPRFTIIRSGS